MKGFTILLFSCGIMLTSCGEKKQLQANAADISKDSASIIRPVYITDTVAHDTDDPAVWINPSDPAMSLIIGTDKDQDGGLYVFDLKGKMQKDKTVRGLQRPDNVDIEYGLMLNGKKTDIAVTTERFTHKLRIYSLPDMKPLDGGGIEVFEGQLGESQRDFDGHSALQKMLLGKFTQLSEENPDRRMVLTFGNICWKTMGKAM